MAGTTERSREMGDRRRFRLPGRPTWALALLAAVLAAAGAFAIGSLTASGAGGGHQARGAHARFQRFHDCMAAHGIKPPRERGSRPSRAQLDRALAACRRYLPPRARQGLARMQRFRSCMSQHGVQPPREGAGRPDRRTLRRALRACREYLPRHGDCHRGGFFFRHHGPMGPGGPPPPGAHRFGIGPPPG